MNFLVSKAKFNKRNKRVTPYEIYSFETYIEALERFNTIKDDEIDYQLGESDYIQTQIDNTKTHEILELHNHRKYIKYFK